MEHGEAVRDEHGRVEVLRLHSGDSPAGHREPVSVAALLPHSPVR